MHFESKDKGGIDKVSKEQTKKETIQRLQFAGRKFMELKAAKTKGGNN